jgi:hypothetical protein
MGIAVAPDGAVWVGGRTGAGFDPYTGTYAHLRRITPDGVVTTDRRINASPHTFFRSLAIDRDGTLYATDGSYLLVHKLTAGAAVSETVVLADFAPYGVAAGPAGEILFTGTVLATSYRVGRLGRDGKFEYVAGFTGTVSSHRDGVGTEAGFGYPMSIAIDASGVAYVGCADGTIRRGRQAAAPAIATAPQSQTVTAGASVQFSVTANAVPAPTYQWRFRGADIAGATNASYSLAAARSADAGEYAVVVTNALGSGTSQAATLTVNAAPNPSGGGGGSSGGGGGGAPSVWFMLALAGLGMARAARCRIGR